MASYLFNLNTMRVPKAEMQYTVDDSFFSARENSLVKKGKVVVAVVIVRKEDSFAVSIDLLGTVQMPCMRCLEDMEVEISDEKELKVKLRSEAGEDNDFLYVSSSDGLLDLEPIIYDYIVLSLPSRNVHEDGKCNPAMDAALKQFLVN